MWGRLRFYGGQHAQHHKYLTLVDNLEIGLVVGTCVWCVRVWILAFSVTCVSQGGVDCPWRRGWLQCDRRARGWVGMRPCHER